MSSIGLLLKSLDYVSRCNIKSLSRVCQLQYYRLFCNQSQTYDDDMSDYNNRFNVPKSLILHEYEEDEQGRRFTETEGGVTKEFKVTLDVLGADAQMRLDHFLQTQEPGETRGQFQKAIQNGLVYVNGMPRKKPGHYVQFLDVIKIFSKRDLMRFKVRPEAIPLDVVYEDDNMLIINKAANMVVYPGWGHSSGTVLNALLHYYGLPSMLSMYKDPYASATISCDKEENMGVDELMYGRFFLDYERDPEPGTPQPRIVNRLDRGTTGLMIISKDLKSHRILSKQFRDRSVLKTYMSVLVGYPSNDSNRIRSNIGPDIRSPDRYGVFKFGGKKGKVALSSYRIMRPLAYGTAALCKWKIRTGRTHQIRLHADHMGNPIFGDQVYGKHKNILERMSLGYEDRRAILERLVKRLGRPALHSLAVGFVHPRTEEDMYFHTNFPDDMQQLIDDLDRLGPNLQLSNPQKDLVKSTVQPDIFDDEDEREAQRYMM